MKEGRDDATYALLDDTEVKRIDDGTLVRPFQEVASVLQAGKQLVVVCRLREIQKVVDLILLGVAVHLFVRVDVLYLARVLTS